MLRVALLVLAVASASGACDGGRAPLERDTVQALALAPANTADAAPRELLAELVDATAFPLAADARWSVLLGSSSALADGGAALATRPSVGGHAISLTYAARGRALTGLARIELRARCASDVQGRVHFRLRQLRGRMSAHSLPFELAAGAEWRTVEVGLQEAALWDGEIQSVGLTFDAASPTRVELLQIALVQAARTQGFEPLGEDEPAPRAARDIGLVARGRDCRRAFAADLGQALESSARVPRDGLLAFAVTGGAALEPEAGPLDVEVALADAAAGARFEPLGSLRVARDALEQRWTLLHFPLDHHAGRDVRIRITARAGVELQRAQEPRERVLVSAPLVLGARPSGGRPNVLFVTLDTTRADVAPRAGHTPNLDRLAARGLEFSRAYSTCNSTTASHASMMTGLLLSAHGAVDNLHLLPGGNATLAEVFRARGWHTAAAVSAEHLNCGSGFGQGFDEYWNAQTERHDGRNTVAGLRAYFDEWGRAPQRPFFAWLHLFDAHTPYGPPPAEREAFARERGITLPPPRVEPPTAPVYADFPEVNQWAEGANNAQYLRALYELGVAWADRCLGEVLDDLERRGWLANTLVVVTADHGEAFGEHESWYAHVTLHEEVVHVPLVVAGPLVPRTGVVDAPSSGLDLYPTLLRVAGAAPPEQRLGVDLFELAAGRTDPSRALYFQLERAQQAGSRTPQWHFIDTLSGPIVRLCGPQIDELGRRAPQYRTVEAGSASLYDVAADPAQARDVADAQPEVVAERRRDLAPTVVQDAHDGARLRVVSPEQLLRLQQLGYMGK